MLYFLLTTGQCNLHCRYCGGSFPRDKVPWEIKYRFRDLKKFLSRDNEVILAFYGGEPLLNHEYVARVLKEVKAKKFIIQTNGTLVKRLKPGFWRKMDVVLLSIDGRKEVTDHHRGKGVYDRVVEAAKYLREIGFKGDLIARMTVSRRTNILSDVKHLFSLKLFNHVHWQLDVVWSRPWRGFDEWLEKSYKPGISMLVKFWLGEMEKGRVPGIVPFQGIIKALIKGAMPSPPCEAGRKAFAISTNGKILVCPIAFDVGWGEIGDIEASSPWDLVDAVKISSPCTKCRLFKYCGGRCLYAYKERYWGMEGFRKICEATGYLIKSLKEIYPSLRGLIGKGIIDEDEALYPPFNNTTEIIP